MDFDELEQNFLNLNNMPINEQYIDNIVLAEQIANKVLTEQIENKKIEGATILKIVEDTIKQMTDDANEQLKANAATATAQAVTLAWLILDTLGFEFNPQESPKNKEIFERVIQRKIDSQKKCIKLDLT